MSNAPQTAAAPENTPDPGAEFVERLRREGWTDANFAMFVSSECDQLRSFTLTNVQTRGR